MFTQIKRLFKHSFVYAIGSIIQSLVGFLLIPLYTHNISTANYGRLQIINTVGTILLTLVTFGFASALMKVYFRDAKTEEEKKNLIGTMFMFVVPISFAATIALYLLSPYISNFLLGSVEFKALFQILFLNTFFLCFMTLGLALLRVKEHSKKYVGIVLSEFAVMMGLNFYFIVYLNLDIAGVLLANTAGYIISCVLLFPIILRNASFKLSGFLLKKLWMFGIPIIPASIAMWFMDLSDRYFLEFFRSSDEVGVYSLGYKIGTIVSVLLVWPFQLSWPTIYFDASRRPDAGKFYSIVLTYFTLIGTFLALVLSVLAPEIIRLISGEAYWDAYKVVPLVAISYVFYGMHFVVAPGVHIMEKTKLYPLLVAIPAGINVGLNFWIVPRYGMVGAAMTTLVSFLLVIILTYFVSNHFYPIKYEWKRIFGIFGIALGVFLASYFLKFDSLTVSVVFKLTLIAVYVAILFLFGYFSKQEIEKVKLLFRKEAKAADIEKN